MYKRDRISPYRLDLQRRCDCLICRGIRWAWFIGVLGALALAINIVKEAI